MLFSMAAVAIGNLLFGFATLLPLALAVRFVLLGAANGWVSLMGMCTLEVAGEEHQAQAFAYIIAVGSIVGTVGPAIGGWTYGALTSSFPALAPSLVGTGLGLLAFAVDYAWLPETRPQRRMDSSIGSERSLSENPVKQRAVCADDTAGGAGEELSLLRVLCKRPFPLALLLRAGNGMAIFAVWEMIPLYSIATRQAGGLALSG